MKRKDHTTAKEFALFRMAGVSRLTGVLQLTTSTVFHFDFVGISDLFSCCYVLLA